MGGFSRREPDAIHSRIKVYANELFVRFDLLPQLVTIFFKKIKTEFRCLSGFSDWRLTILFAKFQTSYDKLMDFKLRYRVIWPFLKIAHMCAYCICQSSCMVSLLKVTFWTLLPCSGSGVTRPANAEVLRVPRFNQQQYYRKKQKYIRSLLSLSELM